MEGDFPCRLEEEGQIVPHWPATDILELGWQPPAAALIGPQQTHTGKGELLLQSLHQVQAGVRPTDRERKVKKKKNQSGNNIPSGLQTVRKSSEYFRAS